MASVMHPHMWTDLAVAAIGIVAILIFTALSSRD